MDSQHSSILDVIRPLSLAASVAPGLFNLSKTAMPLATRGALGPVGWATTLAPYVFDTSGIKPSGVTDNANVMVGQDFKDMAAAPHPQNSALALALAQKAALARTPQVASAGDPNVTGVPSMGGGTAPQSNVPLPPPRPFSAGGFGGGQAPGQPLSLAPPAPGPSSPAVGYNPAVGNMADPSQMNPNGLMARQVSDGNGGMMNDFYYKKPFSGLFGPGDSNAGSNAMAANILKFFG